MSRIAIATLQTPWDCKWSRFGRMHSARPDARVEGLWVCVHGDGVRRPIDASTCETCPYWEYENRWPASTTGRVLRSRSSRTASLRVRMRVGPRSASHPPNVLDRFANGGHRLGTPHARHIS